MSTKEYKLTFKKIWGHFKVIVKHRFQVFCFCCRVGIPIQGLLHDLSKFTPVEFLESARFFGEGKYSPIRQCKMVKGYSIAWIHHKNHNKHHYEYWYDYAAKIVSPPMPKKYFLELVCDSLAAGIVYQGRNWNNAYQYEYWQRVKENAIMHPKMKTLLDEVYLSVKEEGLKPVLKRKRLLDLYQKHIDIDN